MRYSRIACKRLRTHWLLAGGIVCVLCSLAEAAGSHERGIPASLDLFVAPGGDDGNPGTREKPFASLEAARDAIRAAKKSGSFPSGGATVWIRGGFYPRDRVFRLTREDSGSPESPVAYKSVPGEEPRLVGGRPVGGFKTVEDPAVLSRLDEKVRGKVLGADLRAQGITDFGKLRSRGFGRPAAPAHMELFFRGKPMTLARYPDAGHLKIARPAEIETLGDGHGGELGKLGPGFLYEGDRPSRWKSAENVWVHGYWAWDWANTYEEVESIDTVHQLVKTKPPFGMYGYKSGQRFYFLNVLEELDSPGEYYVDAAKGILYFYPPEPVDEGSATVSILEAPLIEMEDASHIAISGLVLECSRGRGIRIARGESDLVSDCTIRNLGNYAVEIEGGRAHAVEDCRIYQIGDGGVSLSGGDREELIPSFHRADGNHLHDLARWSRCYNPAFLASGVGCRISHNLIHDHPHCAILFGGNDHLIEYNEIQRVCLETGDVGAIYAGRDWTARGNTIRWNFIHHTGGVGMGSMGVYLDDCVSGETVFGNVFYKVQRAAFIGGGRDNTVENNIFIECSPSVMIDGRGLDRSPVWHGMVYDFMKKNLDSIRKKGPLFDERFPRLAGLDRYYEKEAGVPPEGNSVVRSISLGGPWLEIHWNATPPMVQVEENLVDRDPGFIDPGTSNFQLRDDSPAYGLGFRKIPFERIGPPKKGEEPKVSIALPVKRGKLLSAEAGIPMAGGEGAAVIRKGELILAKNLALPSRFILEAKVRLPEGSGEAEAPILLQAGPGGAAFFQVFLNGPTNDLRAVLFREGRFREPFIARLPFKVERGKWYTIGVIASGKEAYIYLDGTPCLHATLEEDLASGTVGFRGGSSDFSVSSFAIHEVEGSDPIPCPLAPRCRPDCPALLGEKRSTSWKTEKGEIHATWPRFVRAWDPLKFEIAGPEGLEVEIGASGKSAKVHLSAAPVVLEIRPEPRLGPQRAGAFSGGKEIGWIDFTVWARTEIGAPGSPLHRFFNLLKDTVSRDRSRHFLEGRAVELNPTWIRDHIHEMKGFRYWEEDIESALDLMIDLQSRDGWFYEIVTRPEDAHVGFVRPEFTRIDRSAGAAFVRLELEADIEYLMVEAALAAWESTGDDGAMARRLPALERGIEHCMTADWRWDRERGLMKRPFTIDTWDFTFGYPDTNRRVEPGMPMVIFHGDNSGLYAACRSLSRMCTALGERERAERWSREAERIGNAAEKHLWNGRFYTHQLHLSAVKTGGPPEEEILSLSNAYDMNRGLPNHDHCVSILDEYRARREATKNEYFAEWFSIHPPYPAFFAYRAGQYINGGIASFTAGELAKAALRNGFEDYGWDILERLRALTERDGALFFLYTKDGKNQGGGPSGWGAAAAISALIEGLAGVEERSELFRDVVLSPRWAISGLTEVPLTVRYGPSDGFVSYRWSHDPPSREIRLEVFSSSERIRYRVLVPRGARPSKIILDGKEMPLSIERIEGSAYAVFGPSGGRASARVKYE